MTYFLSRELVICSPTLSSIVICAAVPVVTVMLAVICRTCPAIVESQLQECASTASTASVLVNHLLVNNKHRLPHPGLPSC